MTRRTSSLRIVLSGPIGAGKSTVRRLLAARGFAVIDADSVGHSVLLPDGPAFDAVAERWPATVVNGAIDRRRLAQIVFADRAELAALEAITHPEIAAEIGRRVEWLDERDVVVEMPLLHNIVARDSWHRLVVLAAADVRLQRLTGRGMEEADVRRRMAAQASLDEWERSADSIIWNDRGLDDLEDAVERWVRTQRDD